MSASPTLRRIWFELLFAIQFLTRVPVHSPPYEADALSRAVKFFPFVGLLIGASAAFLHSLLMPHLPRLVAALLVLAYLVYITGCLHEDGLADAADGFGGGWDRGQALLIMRDSRIGSYGTVALTLSLLARLLLISSLSLVHVAQYLVAAHVLCRWTTLPLSFYLAPAHAQSNDQIDGQGARIAQLTTPQHTYPRYSVQLRCRRLCVAKPGPCPYLSCHRCDFIQRALLQATDQWCYRGLFRRD